MTLFDHPGIKHYRARTDGFTTLLNDNEGQEISIKRSTLDRNTLLLKVEDFDEELELCISQKEAKDLVERLSTLIERSSMFPEGLTCFGIPLEYDSCLNCMRNTYVQLDYFPEESLYVARPNKDTFSFIDNVEDVIARSTSAAMALESFEAKVLRHPVVRLAQGLFQLKLSR